TSTTITCPPQPLFIPFFSFRAPPPTEIYTLSLHDALPICAQCARGASVQPRTGCPGEVRAPEPGGRAGEHLRAGSRSPLLTARRSEEHTSELQSRGHLVCRLLLEKKKRKKNKQTHDKYTQT